MSMQKILEGKTILIVEDYKDLWEALCRTVRLHGGHPIAARSLQEGLRILKSNAIEFDAVSTDWNLDGGETSEEIIKFCQDHKIPVVLLTGDAAPAMKKGIKCAILEKPTSPALWIDELASLTTKP